MAEQPASPPDETTETPAEAPPPKTTKTTKTATATKAKSPKTTRFGSPRRAWRQGVEAIATTVMVLAAAFAIILAVHIVFLVFDANGANGIVSTINDWADSLAWKFKDVFTPESPKTAALVNFGLAAVIYLTVGRILSGLIRRLA
jgi:triacylglycerol esterase/lipase EstA (alpha/beta hydrolase family)